MFIVKDEEPFQFELDRRPNTIGYSATGYTLKRSADYKGGDPSLVTWDDYSDAIPANKQHDVYCTTPGLWFRLIGNVGEVVIR